MNNVRMMWCAVVMVCFLMMSTVAQGEVMYRAYDTNTKSWTSQSLTSFALVAADTTSWQIASQMDQ